MRKGRLIYCVAFLHLVAILNFMAAWSAAAQHLSGGLLNLIAGCLYTFGGFFLLFRPCKASIWVARIGYAPIVFFIPIGTFIAIPAYRFLSNPTGAPPFDPATATWQQRFDQIESLFDEHFGKSARKHGGHDDLRRDHNIPEGELGDFLESLNLDLGLEISRHDTAAIRTLADIQQLLRSRSQVARS